MIPCITRTSIRIPNQFSRGILQLSSVVSRNRSTRYIQVGSQYPRLTHSKMSLAPRSPVGSQPGSGRSTPGTTAEEANGYLLLTIQGASATQIYAGQATTLAKGEMRLECVSLPIPAELGYQTANPFSPSPNDPKVPTHDFWLVLRVGPNFEMPLMPEQYLYPSEDVSRAITYSLASPNIPNASLQLTLPLPASAADMEDLDSFEVLLRQYGSLKPDDTALTNVTATPLGTKNSAPLPEEMRGRVVLVNQDNGEVVGQLSDSIDVETDGKVASDNQNKPVILDFGNEIAGYAPKVKIQTVPEDELDDWMLKSAHTLSKGILGFSSLTQKLINGGTDMFVKNTKPAEKDVELGPRTKAGFRIAHNASVRTVNVTKSTVGMINDALSNVAEKTYEKAIEPGYKAYETNFGSKANSPSSASPTTGPPAPPYQPSKPDFPRSPSANQTPVAPSPSGAYRPPPPPPLPARRLEKVQIPQSGSASEKSPLYSSPSSATSSNAPTPSSAKTKRPLLNRIMLAGEVVLTSLEATAHELINTGTAAASTAAGHKYGAQAGHATALAGGAVRNVAVVYIDVRGIGRKALLKGTAKGFVKARLANGETVVLQAEGEEIKGAAAEAGTEGGMHTVEAGQVEERPKGGYVVGMEEIGGKQHPMHGSGQGGGGGGLNQAPGPGTGVGNAGQWGNEKDVTRR